MKITFSRRRKENRRKILPPFRITWMQEISSITSFLNTSSPKHFSTHCFTTRQPDISYVTSTRPTAPILLPTCLNNVGLPKPAKYVQPEEGNYNLCRKQKCTLHLSRDILRSRITLGKLRTKFYESLDSKNREVVWGRKRNNVHSIINYSASSSLLTIEGKCKQNFGREA